MAAARQLRKVAAAAIDKFSNEFFELNQKIWKNPELGYQEKHAHKVLTDFVEEKGFKVSRQYTLDTAFRAVSGECDEGLTVGVMCEYDALPEVGHACGHNLIAEAGVAAGIGIKAALSASEEKLGRVVLLGTPAEEGGGGKVKMIDSDCFNEMDFCMMVHPAPYDDTYPIALARNLVTVTFTGQPAHAAAFPWEGLNALDAAVSAYNTISMLRQQMKPTWRVHGIFTEAGLKPNIIPERAQVQYYVRAPNKTDLDALTAKVHACFEAAAQATGCTADVQWGKLSYVNLQTNTPMAELYRKHAEEMGVKFEMKKDSNKRPFGSTDMGNVSHIKPSIHPMFNIDTDAVHHTHEFREAAGCRVAHERTMLAAKAMAFTAVDILSNPEIMKDVEEDFMWK